MQETVGELPERVRPAPPTTIPLEANPSGTNVPSVGAGTGRVRPVGAAAPLLLALVGKGATGVALHVCKRLSGTTARRERM